MIGKMLSICIVVTALSFPGLGSGNVDQVASLVSVTLKPSIDIPTADAPESELQATTKPWPTFNVA